MTIAIIRDNTFAGIHSCGYRNHWKIGIGYLWGAQIFTPAIGLIFCNFLMLKITKVTKTIIIIIIIVVSISFLYGVIALYNSCRYRYQIYKSLHGLQFIYFIRILHILSAIKRTIVVPVVIAVMISQSPVFL